MGISGGDGSEDEADVRQDGKWLESEDCCEIFSGSRIRGGGVLSLTKILSKPTMAITSEFCLTHARSFRAMKTQALW